jgi:hypothetical protein
VEDLFMHYGQEMVPNKIYYRVKTETSEWNEKFGGFFSPRAPEPGPFGPGPILGNKQALWK